MTVEEIVSLVLMIVAIAIIAKTTYDRYQYKMRNIWSDKKISIDEIKDLLKTVSNDEDLSDLAKFIVGKISEEE